MGTEMLWKVIIWMLLIIMLPTRLLSANLKTRHRPQSKTIQAIMIKTLNMISSYQRKRLGTALTATRKNFVRPNDFFSKPVGPRQEFKLPRIDEENHNQQEISSINNCQTKKSNNFNIDRKIRCKI